jgi:thiol-disulfide isomerase/thioredoxin
MATPSLALGSAAPDFQLADPAGKLVSLADFGSARALLVAFICNHCPYVEHLKPALAAFARDYRGQGLALVAINANDPDSYPADAPAKMAEDAARFDYVFPYLFDATQQVARAYSAVCTPEFFLFDGQRRLAYHGQFDASRPRSGTAATGADLRAAADAVLAGRPVSPLQSPAVGCSIKWRPGNAP